MTNPIGFIVHGVITDEESYFHAIGRCGDEPIHVGDMFDIVYPPAKPGSEGESRQPQPVKFKVERIQAYQQLLPELSGGMTGTIDLRGQGLEFLGPGAVLGTPIHVESSIDSSRETAPS